MYLDRYSSPLSFLKMSGNEGSDYPKLETIYDPSDMASGSFFSSIRETAPLLLLTKPRMTPVTERISISNTAEENPNCSSSAVTQLIGSSLGVSFSLTRTSERHPTFPTANSTSDDSLCLMTSTTESASVIFKTPPTRFHSAFSSVGSFGESALKAAAGLVRSTRENSGPMIPLYGKHHHHQPPTKADALNSFIMSFASRSCDLVAGYVADTFGSGPLIPTSVERRFRYKTSTGGCTRNKINNLPLSGNYPSRTFTRRFPLAHSGFISGKHARIAVKCPWLRKSPQLTIITECIEEESVLIVGEWKRAHTGGTMAFMNNYAENRKTEKPLEKSLKTDSPHVEGVFENLPDLTPEEGYNFFRYLSLERFPESIDYYDKNNYLEISSDETSIIEDPPEVAAVSELAVTTLTDKMCCVFRHITYTSPLDLIRNNIFCRKLEWVITPESILFLFKASPSEKNVADTIAQPIGWCTQQSLIFSAIETARLTSKPLLSQQLGVSFDTVNVSTYVVISFRDKYALWFSSVCFYSLYGWWACSRTLVLLVRPAITTNTIGYRHNCTRNKWIEEHNHSSKGITKALTDNTDSIGLFKSAPSLVEDSGSESDSLSPNDLPPAGLSSDINFSLAEEMGEVPIKQSTWDLLRRLSRWYGADAKALLKGLSGYLGPSFYAGAPVISEEEYRFIRKYLISQHPELANLDIYQRAGRNPFSAVLMTSLAESEIGCGFSAPPSSRLKKLLARKKSKWFRGRKRRSS